MTDRPFLDFALNLLRDEDAAARYLDDPEGSLVQANLGNVTAEDIDALIPSIAGSTPPEAPIDAGPAEALKQVISAHYSPNQNLWANDDLAGLFDQQPLPSSDTAWPAHWGGESAIVFDLPVVPATSAVSSSSESGVDYAPGAAPADHFVGDELADGTFSDALTDDSFLDGDFPTGPEDDFVETLPDYQVDDQGHDGESATIDVPEGLGSVDAEIGGDFGAS